MPKNTVNANFNQIAVSDASDNVWGIRAAVANVQITGGTAGQVLSATAVDGALQWATPSVALTTGLRVLGASIAISASTPTTPTTILTFTIPTAGTWDVWYSMRAQMNAGFPDCSASLGVFNNATNAYIADSSSNFQVNSTANAGKVQLAQRFIVVTTASTVFKIGGWSEFSTGQTQITGSTSAAATTSKVQWMKIG